MAHEMKIFQRQFTCFESRTYLCLILVTLKLVSQSEVVQVSLDVKGQHVTVSDEHTTHFRQNYTLSHTFISS